MDKAAAQGGIVLRALVQGAVKKIVAHERARGVRELSGNSLLTQGVDDLARRDRRKIGVRTAGNDRLVRRLLTRVIGDARIADNAGKQPTDEPVVPGGPDAYFATIPTREIVDALREQGIPAQLSYSAGTFVCNNLLYCALHESAQHDPALRCGFVHVPYLPEQAKDGNAPSVSLELMVKALETAAEVIVEA